MLLSLSWFPLWATQYRFIFIHLTLSPKVLKKLSPKSLILNADFSKVKESYKNASISGEIINL